MGKCRRGTQLRLSAPRAVLCYPATLSQHAFAYSEVVCALITLTRLLWFSFPRLLNGPGVSVVASHSRKCCLMKSVRPSQFALAKKRSSSGVESDLSQGPSSLESTQPQRVRETSTEPWQGQMIPGHASLSSPRNGAEAVPLKCPQHSMQQETLGDRHKLLFRHLPLQFQPGPFSGNYNKRGQCGLM